MARYWPKQTIEITEPCHEEWEAMTGDVRVRHCASCDKDVHNTAALTPQQIEALLCGPGPLPCLRIAHHADGSMLVAEESRAHTPYGVLAGVAMTALVSISSAVAAAQSSGGRVIMGTRPLARSVYTGQVLGPNGKPEQHVHVTLTRSVNGKRERIEAESDAQGGFRLQATPGEWQLEAEGPNRWFTAAEQPVTLHAGEQTAAKPVRLEYITVTAGIPLPPPTIGKPKVNR